MPDLSDEALTHLSVVEQQRGDSDLAAQKSLEQADFAVTDVDDANDLSETGWGVVFAENATADSETALAALLEHRQRDAKDLFHVFKGADGYKKGETARGWLERHGVSFNPVSPTMGVPFYLLLVGSPEEIPLEFRYSLDIYWAVGRLHFDDPARYRTYVESVVWMNTSPTFAQSRKVAHFATRHDFDRATQLFAKHVADPLASGDGKRPAIGQKQKFSSQRLIGDDATKENLAKLLQGQLDGAPALLVSGTHGMALKTTTHGCPMCRARWCARIGRDTVRSTPTHGLQPATCRLTRAFTASFISSSRVTAPDAPRPTRLKIVPA